MNEPYPHTPDGRYFVVKGRLWRLSDPSLPSAARERWVSKLMAARRAVRPQMHLRAHLFRQGFRRPEQVAALVVVQGEVHVVRGGEAFDHLLPIVGRLGVEVVDEQVAHGVHALVDAVGEQPVECEMILRPEQPHAHGDEQAEVHEEPQQDFQRQRQAGKHGKSNGIGGRETAGWLSFTRQRR